MWNNSLRLYHRMKRRILNLLTILSLLLCVAVAALWVRSYWRADCVTAWNTRGRLSAETHSGYLSVEKSNMFGDGAAACRLVSPVHNAALDRQTIRRLAARRLLGFYYATDTRLGEYIGLAPELSVRGLKTPAGPCRRDSWHAPLWAVCLVAGAPGALLLWRRHVLRRRRGKGRCPACGYDLRATPGRCPECGTAPLNASRPLPGKSESPTELVRL